MTPNSVWKSFFNNWPTGIQRRGVLVTCLNEAIPFKGFMIKEDILLLDRNNPDSMGARFILIDFAAINSVRLIDPFKEPVFAGAGFLGKLAKE
jgi:hypothetical protein